MLAGWLTQYGARDPPVNHVACDFRELAVVVARVAPQYRERVVHGYGEVLGDHSLGLLDNHPAVQRRLQLRGQQVALPERAFLDQPDRGHLRHGLGYFHLAAGERLVAGPEQVQGADDVGADPQRDGAHHPKARTGRARGEDRPAGPAVGRAGPHGAAGPCAPGSSNSSSSRIRSSEEAISRNPPRASASITPAASARRISTESSDRPCRKSTTSKSLAKVSASRTKARASTASRAP